MTKTDRTQPQGRMLAHCILLLLWIASQCSGQDDGQAAAHLQTLVNGTLPNGGQFKATSASITSNDTLGILTITKVGSSLVPSHIGCLMSLAHSLTNRTLVSHT
jgi:hypothetical protein